MPTLIQIQNTAAALCVVGGVSAIGFGIALTVDWIVTSGLRCLRPEQRVRGRRA